MTFAALKGIRNDKSQRPPSPSPPPPKTFRDNADTTPENRNDRFPPAAISWRLNFQESTLARAVSNRSHTGFTAGYE